MGEANLNYKSPGPSPIRVKAYRKIMRDLVAQERPKVVCEVGVYLGELSRMLLEIDSIERYIIVDAWEAPYMHFDQAHMDSIGDQVKENFADDPRVSIYHADSTATAEILRATGHGPYIDFWHTDGDHSYEGCKADIVNWRPMVKPLGIMSGDNYEIPTVKQAVDEQFPYANIDGKGRIWWQRL